MSMSTTISTNTIPAYVTWAFIGVTVVISFLFLKRLKIKVGCFSLGYIWLIVFSVMLLTVGAWSLAYNQVKNVYFAMTTGETYTAEVIDRVWVERKVDDNKQVRDIYSPIVRFITDDGQVITKKLEFATSRVNIGETYQVKYDGDTGKSVTLGFTLIVLISGVFIFVVVLTLLSVGIILFVLNREMTSFFSVVKIFGFYFFLPLLMIGFDALLIYVLFNDSGTTVTTTFSVLDSPLETTSETFAAGERPLYVNAMLVFFIFVLTLGIMGYMKMIFSNGKIEIKYKGSGRWIANWKDKPKQKREISVIERGD